MSASKKKQARKEQAPESVNETRLQQQAAAKKDGPSGALYGVVAAAVVVVIAALLVWNSNFFQNRAAAVTINGTDYTAADVGFHYASVRQTQAYYAMYGMSNFDYTTSAKDQVYNAEDGTTWHDYLLDLAVTSLTQEVALITEAEKAGMTLSEDGQASVDSSLKSLETSWITAGYSNRDSYLRATYGTTMTYDKYVECLNRSALANEFYNSQANSYTYSQDELNAYYAEHEDELDAYILTQYIFQASVPTYDDEGNAIEMTDEEKTTALEDAKVEAQANAEALYQRLLAGEDAAKLNEEYTDSLYSSYVSQRLLGSSVNSEYFDWAADPARQDGDVLLLDYQGGSDTTHNYCVVRLEDRYQDTQPSANIRHILISAGTAPTDEEYAEAQAKAEELLQQWKDGGASEDAFAQLAVENSADSGSAANGGLLNVTGYEGYGEAFTNWALDPTHQVGDTGLVKNDFSQTKGYHIMYYAGEGDPYWMQSVESMLINEDLAVWQEELFSSYTAETGSGLKYVG